MEEEEQEEELDEEEIELYSEDDNSRDIEMGDSESVEYEVLDEDAFEEGVSLLQVEDSGDEKTDRPSGDRNGKGYRCEDCGKVLSNFGSYKYHKQLHSDKTPFLCSHCGAGFKTKNAYDGHMITHDDNNPNKCHVCGKTYRQPASLANHLRSHTGEKVSIHISIGSWLVGQFLFGPFLRRQSVSGSSVR